MKKYLSELTSDQRSRSSEWVDKWLKIGLSTEPANFDLAEEAALRHFTLAGIDKPKTIIRAASPYDVILRVNNLLGRTLLIPPQRGSPFNEHPDLLLHFWLQHRSREKELTSRKEVRSLFWSLFWSKIRGQLEEHVDPAVWLEVYSLVGSLVHVQVGANVWAQGSFPGPSMIDSQSKFYCGARNVSDCAVVSFFRDVCELECSAYPLYELEEGLALSCLSVWWDRNILAIVDKPYSIKRDDEGRVHSETGPAIEFRDGWKLYNWHGVQVPPEWIEDRKTLTPGKALSWKNIEQRRAACDILGWDTILDSLNAVSIDKDSDPQIGELVEVNLPGERTGEMITARYLRVQCGTGRQFSICVPPDTKTALDAQSWMLGLPTESFVKPEIRT